MANSVKNNTCTVIMQLQKRNLLLSGHLRKKRPWHWSAQKINRIVIYFFVCEEYFPMLVLLTNVRVWTGGWHMRWGLCMCTRSIVASKPKDLSENRCTDRRVGDRMARKKVDFHLVVWASSSYILLAWGHFLLILVNDFVRGWLAQTLTRAVKVICPATKSTCLWWLAKRLKR